MPRARANYAAVNYRPRIVGFFFFALMLISIPGDELFQTRTAMAIACLAWPHIAYWLALKRGGDKSAERANILIECFFGGAVAAGFALRLWPTTALFSIGVINALLVGGPRFLLLPLALGVTGWISTLLLLGIHPHPDSEPLVTGLSIIAIFSYIALVATIAYRLRQRQREMRAALEREEHQSRQLLLNVFPQAVIPRLKAAENPLADQFADVTVVFADVVDFTPLSEQLGPKRTVLLLNDLFRRFDQAARELGVEKIETTGDGYLAVGGAPEALDNHPEAVADFALAIVKAADLVRLSESEHVQIRVGIHTGPVFAGVVGESRFHYKIFGETVNVASRVQAQSRPGGVLVSETTFKRLRGAFHLEEHGTINLKGHGPMRTYWLSSRFAPQAGAESMKRAITG